MRKKSACTAAMAMSLVATLLLAACGSGGGGKAAEHTGKTVLTVGVVPAFPAAALYLGIKQGIFAKEGLEIKPQVAESGAAEVALALNGQIQAGFISTVVLLKSIEGGAPLQLTAAADVVHTPGYGGLVVPKGSKITSPKDLEGKTIAVNALSGVDNLTVVQFLADAGGDPSQLKVVEVPYPQMQAALTSHRVDAAVMTDPFYDTALAAGDVSPFQLAAGVGGEGALISGYFMSNSFVKANPDVVKSFAKAMDEANAYATAHPDAVRAIIPSYTQLPAASVAKAVLPAFASQLTVGQVQPVIDVMTKFKYLSKPLKAESVIGN
jgi:NitT/TauT family transport system substrate-binding protein